MVKKKRGGYMVLLPFGWSSMSVFIYAVLLLLAVLIWGVVAIVAALRGRSSGSGDGG